METGCRNVLNGIDCSSETCSLVAHDPTINCGNRNFKDLPTISPFLTTNRGVGIKVMQPVPKVNSFICYYNCLWVISDLHISVL